MSTTSSPAAGDSAPHIPVAPPIGVTGAPVVPVPTGWTCELNSAISWSPSTTRSVGAEPMATDDALSFRVTPLRVMEPSLASMTIVWPPDVLTVICWPASSSVSE